MGVLNHPLAEGEPIAPGNFTPNAVFVRFMAAVIAKHGPRQPALDAEARRVGEGYVYVIDGRTPTPEDNVPPEDIIGGFRVQGGKVVPESYFASPNHRLLTSNGFFRLDGMLMECLRTELAARRALSRSTPV